MGYKIAFQLVLFIESSLKRHPHLFDVLPELEVVRQSFQ